MLSLYVNGLSAATVATDAFTHFGGNTLGARSVDTGGLSGKLDDVKLWNRALTAAEVLAEVGTSTVRVPRHRTLGMR